MLRKGLLAALFCLSPLALSETAEAGHGWRHHGAGHCGSAATVYRAPVGHSYASYGRVSRYYGASPYASAYRYAAPYSAATRFGSPYSAYRGGGYGLGYGGYGLGNRGGYGLGFGRPYGGGYGAGWGAAPFNRGGLNLSIGAPGLGWGVPGLGW